jgi:hypothetical protein
MTKAYMTGDRMTVNRLGQNAEFSNALMHLDTPTIQDRDAGRIIAAVLQAPQRFQQHVGYLALPDIPNNSAHRCS